MTLPGGYLTRVAYLWTRTERCKRLDCGATVPLVRQTWLCKKAGRFVALQVSPGEANRPRFTRVQSAHRSEREAIQACGFDPGKFSKGGNTACISCGTVADSVYVKQEGRAGRRGRELMAVACTRSGGQGKVSLAIDELPPHVWPDDAAIRQRIEHLCQETGLKMPEELIPEGDTRNFWVQPYGLTCWGNLFSPRQLLTLLTFVKWVRRVYEEMVKIGYGEEHARAAATALGLWVDRLADYGSSLCRWVSDGELVANTLARQALPMVCNFAEINPFGDASGNAENALEWIIGVMKREPASS